MGTSEDLIEIKEEDLIDIEIKEEEELTQRYHAPSGAPSQNILPALQPASSYAHNGQVANPGAKMKTEDPLRRRSDSDSDESAGYGSILVKRDQGSLLWSCH